MVSIIIPYYNRPEKLERCLNSVLKQSHQEFEILVIDDYSNNPLKFYSDPRIKVFRNQKNLGPGLSRNIGLDKANGKFVVFLDCDDYWHSQFLEKTISEHILYPQISMVYSNGENFDCNGSKFPYRKNFNKTTFILPHILFYGRPWGTGSCVWKSDALKGAKWVAFLNWEDYIFDIERAVRSNSVRGIDEKLVYYDISGEDKLSNRKTIDKVLEKCKGLNYISTVLMNSNFRDDIEVKRGISLHVLNNLTLLLYMAPKEKRYINSNLALLKKWQNDFYPFFINVALKLNRRLAIRLLKYIKFKIKNS